MSHYILKFKNAAYIYPKKKVTISDDNITINCNFDPKYKYNVNRNESEEIYNFTYDNSAITCTYTKKFPYMYEGNSYEKYTYIFISQDNAKLAQMPITLTYIDGGSYLGVHVKINDINLDDYVKNKPLDMAYICKLVSAAQHNCDIKGIDALDECIYMYGDGN